MGLPNWVVAGAEVDLPLPLPTLIGIEVILFALLELKRYEGFKKTGKVGLCRLVRLSTHLRSLLAGKLWMLLQLNRLCVIALEHA